MKKVFFSVTLIIATAHLSSFLIPDTFADSCADNLGCPPGYYCEKAPDDCDGSGTCSPMPGACIDLWNPVCGCNGLTYSNSCYAAAAGVNVAYDGECMIGACGDNGDCPPSYYCAKTPGNCNGPGTCTERPTACPEIWEPVCGCDGQTYSNSCYAAMVGINVAYEGPCISSCAVNGECLPTEYCAKSVGDCDSSGACADRPTACPEVWEPVCGCDEQTYSNSCYAAMAGVNIKYNGICATCVNRPAADLNGDCWVNLADLAMFASEWMTCGMDNQEACFIP